MRHTTFSERNGQAAFAAIVRALDAARKNQRAQSAVQFLLFLQIAARAGLYLFTCHSGPHAISRAMEFHQRSCNSRTSHENSCDAVLICNCVPPTDRKSTRLHSSHVSEL